MVKILIGLIVAVIVFIDYCCCRAASLADRRLEEMYRAEREKESEGGE